MKKLWRAIGEEESVEALMKEKREKERDTGRHQNREREEWRAKEEKIKVKSPEEARLEECK